MKKAQMKFIVSIIAILAFFIIVLVGFIYPQMIKAKEAGESGVCGLQFYLQSMKKYSGVSLPNTPAECEASDIVIDISKIKDYLDDAEESIDKYYDSPSVYHEALAYFEKTESSYWEWAMDKIIADALFDCWVLKGNFGATNTVELLSYDVNCLICSYIRFKDTNKIIEKISSKKGFFANEDYIGSLGAFLRVEEKGYGTSDNYDKKTYSEWLNNNYQWYPVGEIPYLIGEEYAVSFVMSNKLGSIPLVGDFQKNWIDLRPSNLLTSNYDLFGKKVKACEKTFG